MTPSREDYLKAIYTANNNDVRVTNKMISMDLRISPPSVSEMLNKLIEEDLIRKDEEKGYVLTRDGQRDAKSVLRKHRLWEVFLVDYLGYGWDDVHDDAEILEHATSTSLANRLNEFLKHPKYCPHGSIIYGNSAEEEQQYSLTHFNPESTLVIKAFSDDKKFLQYIRMKKLAIGTIIKIDSIDPFDQTYRLIIDEEVIYISELAAKEIYVSYYMEENNE